MRKHTVTNIKTESFLPAIKSSLSSRKLFNNSPNTIHSPSQQDLLLNSDSSRAFPTHSVSLNLNLNKKVSNLLKIIKDQDEKIKKFETSLNINNPNSIVSSSRIVESVIGTYDPSEIDTVIEYTERTDALVLEEDEKNLEEFYVQALTRDKQKDIAIFKLKKQIEEENAKIQKLVQEGVKHKRKEAEMYSAIQAVAKYEAEICAIKEKCKEDLRKIEEERALKEQELNEKGKDIRSLAELIHQSEEKRQYSNEYNIFMESNEQKLKDKIKALEEEKKKIQKQISEVVEQIAKQVIIVENLENSFNDLQEDLESERQKGESMLFNLGIAEDSLEESLSQQKLQERKFALDLRHLKDQLEGSHDSEKSGSISDKYFLAGISKDETLKLHQQYSLLERDLTYAREALERLKRNEIYLNNQLSTKDFMINQIEKLLLTKEENSRKEEERKKEEERRKEEEERKKIGTGKYLKNGIGELQGIVKEMIGSYSEELDDVKCVECYRIAVDGMFLVPCGHLVCSGCWDKELRQCVKCGESAGVIKSKNLSKIIAGLKLDVDSITKAGKLLNLG